MTWIVMGESGSYAEDAQHWPARSFGRKKDAEGWIKMADRVTSLIFPRRGYAPELTENQAASMRLLDPVGHEKCSTMPDYSIVEIPHERERWPRS